MSPPPTAPLSALPHWLGVLQQVYTPQRTCLVGAGNGTGPLVQWLLSQADQHPSAQLFEANASAVQQLARRLPEQHNYASESVFPLSYQGWQVLHELLVPHTREGEPQQLYYHQFDNMAENGLLSAQTLKSLWPSLQPIIPHADHFGLVGTPLSQWLPAQPASNAPPANWLMLDCMPAAALLAHTLLTSVDVLLVRGTQPGTLPEGHPACLSNLVSHLQANGLRHVASFEERNTCIVKALYVRDPAQVKQILIINSQQKSQLQNQVEILEGENKRLSKIIDSIETARALEIEAKAEAFLKISVAHEECERLSQRLKDEHKNKLEEKNALLEALNQKKALESQVEELIKAHEGKISQLKGLQAEVAGFRGEKSTALESKLKKEVDGGQDNLNAFSQFDLNKIEEQFNLKKEFIEDQAKKLTTHHKLTIDEAERRLRNEFSKSIDNAVRQIEAFQRIRDFLGSTDSLGDFHGWPISPDIGIFLLDRIREEHYDLIIEFGSGTSTALFARAVQIQKHKIEYTAGNDSFDYADFKTTRIVTFEHDAKYRDKTLKFLKSRSLDADLDLVHAPLVPWKEGEDSYLFYNCKIKMVELSEKYQNSNIRILVFVDGPPGGSCTNARYPAVPLIFETLGQHQIDVVLDDASRPDEKKIVEFWRKYWSQRSISMSETFLQSEKGIYFAAKRS